MSNDGGQAFPVSIHNLHVKGMSLRDYFAAHAPRRAQWWFEPTMPPRPESMYDHDHPSAQCFECCAVNYVEVEAWQTERRRQFLIQWPYAWADVMLAERVKS